MHVNIRRSSLKHRKRAGYRRRMKTKKGAQIITRQRHRAAGKGKHNRSLRGKSRARTLRKQGRS